MDNRKHGMWNTPEYRTWRSIINRCRNSQTKDYPMYGGRGIEVCARWDSFENFFADMRTRPSIAHSIERKDTYGDYEPDNCKWASRSEQQRNKRNNRLVTLRGETLPLAIWAERLNLTWATLFARLKADWSEEKIFATAQRTFNRR